MAQPRSSARGGGEDDESEERDDNSLGRVLTLSDGVFAIAMTLLAFNLKVPVFGSEPGDTALRHALAHQTSAYLSFAVSFYVIASYWNRHRRLMRSVETTHPSMVRKTMFLLFIVAAMPFLASLLGDYGGTPIALALYGIFNFAAMMTLLQLRKDVRRLERLDQRGDSHLEPLQRRENLRNLSVFLLCIPAGYVLGSHGPFVLVLLALPVKVPRLERLKHRWHPRASA